ncbi:hypothetical protein ACP4OV_028582 [Aristida adscensionis]
MEAAMAAMGALISKLGSLLSGEYRVQSRLSGEIRFLIAELEYMEAALRKMSDAPVIEDLVNNLWAKEVRELSYDVEDIIDKFRVRVSFDPSAELGGLRGLSRRTLRLFTTARLRRSIAADIRVMRNHISVTAERRGRYMIDTAPPANPTPIDPRLLGPREDKLVGISGPQDRLISELLNEPGSSTLHRQKVICIVGVGGLGKTTLASTVYQQLRGQFDCHASVTVSLSPDLRKILRSILYEVSQQNYGNTEEWGVLKIIEEISLFLKDKRYLIVLDDIWDNSMWNCIKGALVDNNLGSRIIITSRVHDVAGSEPGTIIYKLHPLSYNDSMKLFYKRIFGCEHACQSELEEIAEEILSKCGGIPLAINTIASLLSGKPRNIDVWSSVNKSIGSGVEESSMENVRKVLSISYYSLPSHLKACLLYLSIFPEDYSILRDQLIRRWISEGFIPGEDVSTLYENGENCFNELINRSLIEPEYIDTHGRVQACRVHDMVLDLIKSLSYEENFVSAVHGQQFTELPNKIRRMSLQGSTDSHAIQGKINLSHLKSLIVFPHAANMLPPLSRFHILRVLDFEGCYDLEDRQINDLKSLCHLRCLILKDTGIANVPKGIKNLHYLQTLDLRNTSISKLPAGIVHLRQLVRLHIDKSVILPFGFGNMTSLEALSFVSISKSPGFSEELEKLTKLRILHITLSGTWHTRYEKPLIDSLCKLENLRELCIHTDQVSTEFISDLEWIPQYMKSFSGGQLSKLPRWVNSSLKRLCTIDITIEIITQKDLKNLGALEFLLDLSLTVLEVGHERLVLGTDHEEFRSLIKFWFASNAMRLLLGQQAMPRLQNLELCFSVQETKDLNFGLENLSSLKLATVRIDCGGSSIDEVKDADAAIRKAVSMNPNRPSLHVLRHYEADMMRDDAMLQVHDETTEIEEQSSVTKMGPWGGNGGRPFNIPVESRRLESVILCSATIVDALAFSYVDANGKQHTTPLWGGIGGSAHMALRDRITLGPSEFLLEISGTVGSFGSLCNAITSLKFVTNKHTHGPFGVPKGTAFCSRVKKNDSIVGFFGRYGKYLDAIGVYLGPI